MSCSAHAAIAGAARTPVMVNRIAIDHNLISREAQNHPARTPVAAWSAAARALVVREVLVQEAHRLALRPVPATDEAGRTETDEEALVRALVEQEVATPIPTEDECRRYYERNLHRFRTADIYEASHILIAARGDQLEAYAAAREWALALLSRLERDGHRFAEMAAAHSDCPSAAAGGNLGQLTAGSTTPEFERALLALTPGEMSRTLVETRYGFHIVRFDRHIPGRDLPFEMARDWIAGYLCERAQRIAAAQYVARLLSRADVSGIDLPTTTDLRVA